jgi:CRISPR-associated (Cas) DxTHG family
MATYIIAFIGTAPSDKYYRYTYQGKAADGRVFPEALRKLIDVDRMYVCVTEDARNKNWHILADDDGIEAIDIPDGKNPEELWRIFDKIKDIFSEKDEVIFDITQGYRSLPFLSFIFAAYLKVAKTVQISSVLYGALEQGKPSEIEGIEKIVPVIQIGEFVSMFDWMSCTQRFVDLGDGNGLAQLLRKIDVPDLELKSIVDKTANAIERVSDSLIYIRPMEVMESVAELKDLIPEIETQGRYLPQLQPFLLLCEKIVDRYENLALAKPLVPNHLEQNLQCQLRMMTWYQKHQQQVKSIMLGRELFVSILMYWQGDREIFDYKTRKPAEVILNGKKGTDFDLFPDSQTIKDTWKKSTELRNDFAHTGMSSAPESIDSLKQKIDGVIEEIQICLDNFLAAASDREVYSIPLATTRPKPRSK